MASGANFFFLITAELNYPRGCDWASGIRRAYFFFIMWITSRYRRKIILSIQRVFLVMNNVCVCLWRRLMLKVNKTLVRSKEDSIYPVKFKINKHERIIRSVNPFNMIEVNIKHLNVLTFLSQISDLPESWSTLISLPQPCPLNTRIIFFLSITLYIIQNNKKNMPTLYHTGIRPNQN